jgi:hypothetical protein
VLRFLDLSGKPGLPNAEDPKRAKHAKEPDGQRMASVIHSRDAEDEQIMVGARRLVRQDRTVVGWSNLGCVTAARCPDARTNWRALTIIS